MVTLTKMKRKASFFIDDILHSDEREVARESHHVIDDVRMTRGLHRDGTPSSYSRLAALKQRSIDHGRSPVVTQGNKVSTMQDANTTLSSVKTVPRTEPGVTERLLTGSVTHMKADMTSPHSRSNSVTCVQTRPTSELTLTTGVSCAQTVMASGRIVDSRVTCAQPVMTSERLLTNGLSPSPNKLDSLRCYLYPTSDVHHLVYKDTQLVHRPETVRVQPSPYLAQQYAVAPINPQLRSSVCPSSLDAIYEHNVGVTSSYIDELRQFPWIRHDTGSLINPTCYPYGELLSHESARTSWLKESMRQYPFPFYTGSPMTSSCDLLPQKTRRSRTVFTELQLLGLEKRFESQKYLSNPERASLAKTLGLSQIQVKTWYQNRRMKWKKQASYDGECENEMKPKGRPKKCNEQCVGSSEQDVHEREIGHDACEETTDDDEDDAHEDSARTPDSYLDSSPPPEEPAQRVKSTYVQAPR